MKGAFGAACALMVLLSPACAQPIPPERPPDAERPPEATAPPNTAPPYQLKLDRLAELMGTLAFMKDLCRPGEGAVWRSAMGELLTAEATTVERRSRLAGAFNQGFNSYRTTYRHCTPSAEAVIQRSLDEGSSLANDLAARFGS